ncbi:Hypothetical predicted protein [Paramuricea clavata]|uniref:Uncharacterized protein n=1 Tax=Paramuricea clavata TaxID=317549 RepID=A0A7D9D7F6_PARCT|nr:Hypothetical predicted protein [Paramuricea clavata]
MAASINLHRIVYLFILLMRRRRRRMRAACRTIWSRTWIQRHQRRGIFVNLLRELEEDPEIFRQYHRFDINSFRKILRMVEPYIKKKDTVMRVSISPGERLSVTLRFLATGESFRSLSFQYRIGERTVSNIISETCQALYEAMKQQYLKVGGHNHCI